MEIFPVNSNNSVLSSDSQAGIITMLNDDPFLSDQNDQKNIIVNETPKQYQSIAICPDILIGAKNNEKVNASLNSFENDLAHSLVSSPSNQIQSNDVSIPSTCNFPILEIGGYNSTANQKTIFSPTQSLNYTLSNVVENDNSNDRKFIGQINQPVYPIISNNTDQSDVMINLCLDNGNENNKTNTIDIEEKKKHLSLDEKISIIELLRSPLVGYDNLKSDEARKKLCYGASKETIRLLNRFQIEHKNFAIDKLKEILLTKASGRGRKKVMTQKFIQLAQKFYSEVPGQHTIKQLLKFYEENANGEKIPKRTTVNKALLNDKSNIYRTRGSGRKDTKHISGVFPQSVDPSANNSGPNSIINSVDANLPSPTTPISNQLDHF